MKKISTVNLITSLFGVFISIAIVASFWMYDINKASKSEIQNIKKLYLANKKNQLKTNVDIAVQSMYISKEYTKKENATQEKIKQTMLKRLSKIRFGNDGYFFVYTNKGICLMHPILPSLVGKNLINLKDANGKFLIQELIKASQNPKHPIVDYLWMQPSTKKITEKIGYAREFKDWGWMIGSGIYISNLNKEIQTQQEKLKSKLRKDILLIILIFLLVSTIIGYFIYNQSKKIKDNFEVFHKFIENPNGKSDRIDIKQLKYEEFINLAKARNSMLDNKEKLEDIAYNDYLTKIPNRLKFIEKANVILNISKRNNISISVFFIDLDGFKIINDIAGHEKGDEILQNTAQILKNTFLREDDVYGRFGGDEFVSIVLNVKPKDLEKIAKSILNDISKIDLPENIKKTFGASIGIIHIEDSLKCDKLNIEDLLAKSDELMYTTKKKDKNNFTIKNICKL